MRALVVLFAVAAGCGVEEEPYVEADVEEADVEALQFGGGGGDGPTIPPVDCDGYTGCYNFCRWIFQCQGPTWDECDDLSRCLDNCDAQFPTCM